ncbi:MAG: hypothetical protein KDA80_08065 [Planctomycetaceae bacterium]|nr:hypothetical protein [Planctomycetaceae bacterium]
MKRTVPLIITAAAGFILIVAFFIPAWQPWGEDAAVWFDILASIAFVLGGGNLLKLHLQNISDQKPGWGYSGVTLAAFLITLIVGLLKLSCPPEASVEFYGQSFVAISEEAIPVFEAPGETDFEYRGWMTPAVVDDLTDPAKPIAWNVAIEELAEIATLPELLQGKLRYDADHDVLAFRGTMTPEEEAAIRELLPNDEETSAAIDRLAEKSRRESSVSVGEFPPNFSIPDFASDRASRSEDSLSFRGPMSTLQRDEIAKLWPNFPFARPLSSAQQQDLLKEIETHGPPLSQEQRDAVLGIDDENGNDVQAGFFELEWDADQLIQEVNNAGAPQGGDKTWREIQAEIENGVERPALKHPPADPVSLNADQVQFMEQFVEQANLTVNQLIDQLAAAGPLTDRQRAAIGNFFDTLPTVADRRRELAFVLLENGSLSSGQIDFLMEGARDQFEWRQTVGRLFMAAHQTKYPWSGSYSAQGSPFWWIYEYIFQPLLTTTFAMLAFYVASAAFRAFRAKNLEATLLLGTAFIILLGRTFLGAVLSNMVPDALSILRVDQLTIYIMSIFNTAGNRAIMIGIALGIASTSLKVLLGIDRSYLGSGDD